MKSEKFLVQWSASSGPAKTFVWDSRKPMPLGGLDSAWLLEKGPQGLRLRDYRNPRGRVIVFNGTIAGREGRLQVRPYEVGVVDAAARSRIAAVTVHAEPERDTFVRSLQVTLGVLGLFLATTLSIGFFKKSDVQVDSKIIPPQFAKVLLKPQPKEKLPARAAQAGGAPGEGTSSGASKGPQSAKVENTAVVKAFRAKALQSAVQGLLKGGMTALLAAEGQLLAGDSKHQAARMFDRAAEGFVPATPDAQAGNGRGVQVATLGGGGGGGAGGGLGSRVGYGAGQGAAISGQGQSFVSLDIPGSSVDEGLTKDEVGKVIHSHISEIRYCYESSMLRAPDIEGKLVLDFTIGGNGTVKTGAVKESSLNDPRLDDCILRRLTKWSFPKPNGGVDVAVSYPFVFKALKR